MNIKNETTTLSPAEQKFKSFGTVKIGSCFIINFCTYNILVVLAQTEIGKMQFIALGGMLYGSTTRIGIGGANRYTEEKVAILSNYEDIKFNNFVELFGGEEKFLNSSIRAVDITITVKDKE